MAVLEANIILLVIVLLPISEGRSVKLNSLNSTTGGNSTDAEYKHLTPTVEPDNDDVISGLCRLTTVDPYLHDKVVQMLAAGGTTLVEYQLNFTNYTHNPLSVNVAGTYDAKKWSRVTTAHGQMLLSLAFNYGALSMMTLTLGTRTLNVELRDLPPGCMGDVTAQHKIDSVRHLLMRDFDANGPITTVDDGRVCHEIIEDEGGYAKFRHSCCYKNSITRRIVCTTDIGNIWLNLLYSIFTLVRLGLIFFGPLLFVSAVLSMSEDSFPYIVRLTTGLHKTVCFYCGDETDDPLAVSARRSSILDLSSSTDSSFPKLRDCLYRYNVKLGQPVKVCFSEYHINVDYKRLQKENAVPSVGLFHSLFSAIFLCKLRSVGPLRLFCKSKIFRSNRPRPECLFRITWGKVCKRLGKVLLVLLVPVPFYARLVIFYQFEYEEVARRKRAIEVGGLIESMESSLIHYFTPTHGVFISMYILYMLTAIALMFLTQKDGDHREKKVIIDSFRDLKYLDFTDTVHVVVSNMIWPLKRYGALGCCVGLVYWPIAIVDSVILGAVYFLPTLYLTVRMAYNWKLAAVGTARMSHSDNYQARAKADQDMYNFLMENRCRTVSDDALPEDDASTEGSVIPYPRSSWLRMVKCVICAVLSILMLYSIVLIVSEVVGCLVEIVAFTIMGCIVNASALLKYAMLIVVILIYCGDCFTSLQKRYLKINKALFSELMSRIRNDVEAVASQPPFMQENIGFKFPDPGKLALYDHQSDLVSNKRPHHWMINDLLLFLDSEDTPRIPIQLFDRITNIRVTGVPGPVYRGHIEVIRHLSKIIVFVCFVFLLVLSFGSVHQISETTQTLAALVGGFLPQILGMFLTPPSPDVEVETLSFRAAMSHVLRNMCQYWPIYDLPFEVVEEDQQEGSEDERNNAVEPATAAEHPMKSDCVELTMDKAADVDLLIWLPSWSTIDYSWDRDSTSSFSQLREAYV